MFKIVPYSHLNDGKQYYVIAYETHAEVWWLTTPLSSLELISKLSEMGLEIRKLLQEAYTLP